MSERRRNSCKPIAGDVVCVCNACSYTHAHTHKHTKIKRNSNDSVMFLLLV